MISFTPNKRRLATIALIAGTLTILAPVAQADTSFRGSPDAIDRALATRQLEKTGVLDARERSMLTRPTLGGLAAPPDAFERALQNRAADKTSLTIAMLDARQRALTTRPVASSAAGFDWGDFGIGAGAGIGFILVSLGLGVGVLGVRHGHGRVANP